MYCKIRVRRSLRPGSPTACVFGRVFPRSSSHYLIFTLTPPIATTIRMDSSCTSLNSLKRPQSDDTSSDEDDPPIKKLDARVDSMMSSTGSAVGDTFTDLTRCSLVEEEEEFPEKIVLRKMRLVETEADYRYDPQGMETTGPWITRATVHLEKGCDRDLQDFLQGEQLSAASDLLFRIPNTEIKHEDQSYKCSRVVLNIPDFNRYEDVSDPSGLEGLTDHGTILTFLPDDMAETNGGVTKIFKPAVYINDYFGTVTGDHKQAVHHFNTSTSPDLDNVPCKITLTSSLFDEGGSRLSREFDAEFVGSRMYFNVVSLFRSFDDHLKFCYMEDVDGDGAAAGEAQGAPRGRAVFGYHHQL